MLAQLSLMRLELLMSMEEVKGIKSGITDVGAGFEILGTWGTMLWVMLVQFGISEEVD